MKTEILEPGTDSLPVPEQLNRTGTTFRATETDVLRTGRQTSLDKSNGSQPVVLPNDPEIWRLFWRDYWC